MPVPFSGGCRCGAVRYECNAEPAQVAHCHCRDCQYAAGGGYSTIVIVPTDSLRITGAVEGYEDPGDSGKVVRRQFCPTCGTPVFSEPEIAPGIKVIKAGSLDDPSWLVPQAHVYVASAQPWGIPSDALPRFDKMPA